MIIVTGANGFIGSNLVKTLLARGEKNILGVDYVLDRPYLLSSSVGVTLPVDFYSNLKYFLRNAKYVFHEGAISSTVERDRKLLFERNVDPTMSLIYYCRDNNIPLQYASSASVYGNPTKETWDQEQKPLAPLNRYAESKRSCDYIADSVMKCKRPPEQLQGLRYFNVYGPNEDHKLDQASPYHKFSQQLKKTGRIQLFEGSENFYRDFISVEQLIMLKLFAIEHRPSGIYDAGTSKPKSFYTVACEVCEQQNIDLPSAVIDWVPMPEHLKAHYQSYSKANMSWAK